MLFQLGLFIFIVGISYAGYYVDKKGLAGVLVKEVIPKVSCCGYSIFIRKKH